MKVNLILLIIFCLLQVLNSSLVRLDEQSLKKAAAKTLKYAKAFHEDSIIFEESDKFNDLKFNFPPLDINNVQFIYDLFGFLHVAFTN